jgi:ABC-type sugar transport system substrate-binding protein
MKDLRIVVSLPNDNAYQHEQGAIARATGGQLGLNVEVLHAHDDAITQSQQILGLVQAPAGKRPTAFIVEPVTANALKRVAEEAVAAGIAWVVSNSEVDYVKPLRAGSKVPVFVVTQGQYEIGRVQGKQIAALLPKGGNVLLIEGPSMSSVTKQRRDGLESARSKDVQIATLRSKFNEESAFQSVAAWLKLATSKAEKYDLVAGQTHELALGARKALLALADEEQKRRWMEKKFLGIGVANQVKPLVDKRTLAAAVVTSVTMQVAMSLLVRAFDAKTPVPECNIVDVSSYPELDALGGRGNP